ncbi:TRAP transporter large permease [uncultured Oscillibacter sp.]|uniref:TRAP transporter large permease n=1 Tax=uncultured Oscillibacter sp. TaxID=876091 RepID=UPI0025EAC1BD|nr:TRAP transporter large permease [uncultured Oscillibacter sp.]
MSSAWLLFGTFLLLCLLRAPVAVALLLSAVVAAWREGVDLIIVAQQIWQGLDSFTMLAIPLFLLAGTFMESGGIVTRIAKFADTCVGHVTGSLGHVVVVCNMVLAGVSGSATADAAAVGGMFIPMMKKNGYSGELAAAISAAAATMGPIIPPSLIMVVYASTAGVSTGALFLAGVLPGILVGITQMIVVYRTAKKENLLAAHGRAPLAQVWKDFLTCLPALLVPFIIIVGIVAGIFTATEAAMVAAVYCLLVAMFVYRTIRARDLFRLFKSAAISSAPCLFCIASASFFGWMLAYLNIPNLLMSVMSRFVSSTTSLLLVFTVLFIIIGMFMDALPAIVIFYPIVNAMSLSIGCDPMHVAIVISLVLCFGLMTPPYGITLLLSSQIAGVRSMDAAKLLFPFYFMFLVLVLVVIFVPEIALFLPKLLMPSAF